MVYNEENSDYSEYWTEIVSRKMSGDVTIDNVENGQEGTKRDKNVSDEFLNLDNKYVEKQLEKEKCSEYSSSNKMFELFDCTVDFKCNNFGNENDFEESYENEYFKKLGATKDFDPEVQVSDTIRLWLQVMDKKLDYVYNYEMPDDEDDKYENDDYEDYDDETLESCVCDPITSLDKINYDSIEEIVNITSNKGLTKVQGKCLLRLKDGTELSGSWQNGKRNGHGSFSGPLLAKLGVTLLAGNYVDGLLSGIGRIHMKDESVREGWFCKGRADGPFRGIVKGSGLVWLGHYEEGVPTGRCWQAVQGEAWLVGQLDEFGQMTGPDVAFLYPDLKTALVGEFKNGELLSAFHSQVISVREESGLLIPSFEKVSETEFRQWPSSRNKITCPLHLRDPYEDQLVEVCTSKVSGSGDGLQAKVKIPAGTLVAYYHGVRMKGSDEYLTEKSTGYAINLEWDLELRKTSDVLDILPQYQSTTNYTSTLAHKINHSFKPNCEWIHARHPCYGKIPAILTLEDLKEGQELFIHYGYDMDEAPQWYIDFWTITG